MTNKIRETEASVRIIDLVSYKLLAFWTHSMKQVIKLAEIKVFLGNYKRYDLKIPFPYFTKDIIYSLLHKDSLRLNFFFMLFLSRCFFLFAFCFSFRCSDSKNLTNGQLILNALNCLLYSSFI